MLRNTCVALLGRLPIQPPILKAEQFIQQQLRTTYILRRKHPPPLHKLGQPPRKMRTRHYIYEVVKDTNLDPPVNLDLILTKYVADLGYPGDCVSVKANEAYEKLLLPGLAVYASPDNLSRYQQLGYGNAARVEHSSTIATLTQKYLSEHRLSVVMSKDQPWTLEPWHVKVSFRKSGFEVPAEAIELPETPITGPDLDLENKVFFVTVTINNLEKQKVGCRLHHWSTVPAERLLHEHEFWKKPIELMFPETDAEAMEAHVKIMNRLQEEFLDRQRETILRQNEVMKRRSDRRARRALAKKKKRH